MAETNLSKMIETALENIKIMTDANTVVGDPIKIDGGTTVIPVSKISVGFASGGLDFNSKAAPEKTANFGGGTGSGFTLTPIAFLVVDEIGNVNLLNLGAPTGGGNKDLIGTISDLVDKAPSMIEKITKIFKKDKNKPEDNENQDDAVVLDNADMANVTAE